MKPKKRTIQRLAELSAISLVLSSTAFAQNGGGHIGGGGEDIVFKSIRDEIKVWLEKNIVLNTLEAKLELKEIAAQKLYSQFNQAVQDVGEKVIFNDEEIRFGNNVRICKNDRDTKVITCNLKAWNETAGNTRYAIVFHEYLGIAGIESNIDGDYSTYPISPKILGFVKTKESFELGMEKQQPEKTLAETGIMCTSWPQQNTSSSNFKRALYFVWKPNGDYFVVYQKVPQAQYSAVIDQGWTITNNLERLYQNTKQSIQRGLGGDIKNYVLYRGNSMDLIGKSRKIKLAEGDSLFNVFAYTESAIEKIAEHEKFPLYLDLRNAANKVSKSNRDRVQTLICSKAVDTPFWGDSDAAEVFENPNQNVFTRNFIEAHSNPHRP